MAALASAFRGRHRTKDRRLREQLTLIGMGILATGGIAVVTNVLLPYGFNNFRFCDLGTLSTLFFVLAVAYATLIHRLFELRVILRETLVYGLLLTFVLGAYSSAVFVVTQYLSNGNRKVVQFAVLLIAFSVDPLRRFLEKETDRLLFDERKGPAQKKKRSDSSRDGRSGNRFALALLFPWRRPFRGSSD